LTNAGFFSRFTSTPDFERVTFHVGEHTINFHDRFAAPDRTPPRGNNPEGR
jgi:hypothetical protein